MEQSCRTEIEELHAFFQGWFNAALPDTEDAFRRFAGVMADGFTIVTPGGRTVDRGPLIEGLWRSHGRWREVEGGGRIRIANVRLRHLEGETALLTYEEWQQAGAGDRGRLSTALFRRAAGTPNGVEWLHVHEVWLPDE
jgi:hypothetical protein